MTDIDEGGGTNPPAVASTATDGDAGWFAGVTDDTDPELAANRVQTGSASAPRDWPSIAVNEGIVDSQTAYYDRLHVVTTAATRSAGWLPSASMTMQRRPRAARAPASTDAVRSRGPACSSRRTGAFAA